MDPKLTELFLLTQDDVADASVWLDRGELRASVTPTPGVRLDPSALLGVCAAAIGAEHTPRDLYLVSPRLRA